MLGSWATCETKGYWAWFRTQVPKARNIHLHSGAAFASAIEAARKAYYIKGAPQEEAAGAGLRALWRGYGVFDGDGTEQKSWNRMSGALIAYLDEYPFATDQLQPYYFEGAPVIEFSFALPLKVLHPETGEHVLLTGRFDMVGEARRLAYITDEKTTGQLGAKWAQKWDMHSQFLDYMWAALEYGIPAVGACVRGIAIYKAGYEFAESFPLYTKRAIKDNIAQIERTVEKMKVSWAENEYDQNGIMSGACGMFAGCQYKLLCQSDKAELWLPTHYQNYRSESNVESTP